jgi:protein-disulfide isomerase
LSGTIRFALVLLAGLVLGAADAPKPVPPPSPLDMVRGKTDAPLTVIEYGSLTCPHCAEFEKEILPELQRDWIDTGKIRFIFRDMPRDRLDLQAFQFAHCSGDDRFFAFLDSLYGSQVVWVPSPDPVAEFVRLGRLGGLSEAKIRDCVADQTLARASAASAQAGHDAGVDVTPTFFLDGKKIEPRSYADWQSVLGQATKGL